MQVHIFLVAVALTDIALISVAVLVASRFSRLPAWANKLAELGSLVLLHPATSGQYGDLYDAEVDGPWRPPLPLGRPFALSVEREWHHTRRFEVTDQRGGIHTVNEWTPFTTTVGPDCTRTTREGFKRYETTRGFNLMPGIFGEYHGALGPMRETGTRVDAGSG